MEELAELVCWEKKYEKGDIAIWYTKMETCITPFPKVSSASKVACGKLEKFPARPFAVPSWITEGLVESYQEDNKL
ncbi:hypothetical protein Golax_020246 [Gossypium laxum]|nr:hypothetical protein [Gossypium laxum]